MVCIVSSGDYYSFRVDSASNQIHPYYKHHAAMQSKSFNHNDLLIPQSLGIPNQPTIHNTFSSSSLSLPHLNILTLPSRRLLRRNSLPILLLGRQPRLSLLMRLIERLFRDEEATHQPNSREADVHDPDILQTVRQNTLNANSLSSGKSSDGLGVGAGVGTREKRCELWTNNLLDCGSVRVYFVLEDDLADDD